MKYYIISRVHLQALMAATAQTARDTQYAPNVGEEIPEDFLLSLINLGILREVETDEHYGY